MSIPEALASATRYLSEHPEEARYRDSYARATIEGGLAVRVEGPGGESLRSDMPKGIGGAASDPSPGWLMRAATASCVATLLAIRAAALGIELGTVEVDVDSESDDRGILGIDQSIAAGPLSMRIGVRIEARGRNRAELDELTGWALDHCPVVDAIRRAVPVEVEVEGGVEARTP